MKHTISCEVEEKLGIRDFSAVATSTWKVLLRAKQRLEKCVKLKECGEAEWKGDGSSQNFKNIYQTVRRKEEVNEYARV